MIGLVAVTSLAGVHALYILGLVVVLQVRIDCISGAD